MSNQGKILLYKDCSVMLLLLLLSRFSRVRLCAIPQTAATRLPVPGILQARTLEWVAISFSNVWKWKVKGKSLSRVQLLATPWTAAYQAPPSMGFSRQSTGVGCHSHINGASICYFVCLVLPLPSETVFQEARVALFKFDLNSLAPCLPLGKKLVLS